MGAPGIISIVSIFLLFKWGYWSAIAVSITTIAFDIWGALAIYPTALLGIPVPVFLLLYFMPRRSQLLEGD